MDIVVNEEHVQLLISMGFPDDFEVRRALRLAKNDINEAVSFLTNEVPGLHDVEMTVPLPSSSNDNYQTSTTTDAGTENMEIDENVDTLEFPATHLYELESRVFTSSWSIPYKKEESLGRCLNASIRLAKERLTESDENCRRFLENCMPACFDKLMTAYQVNRWGQEVQEGIFQMLQLFIDLICLRLQYDPVPTRMMDVLSLCLDPNTNYHQKNSRKLWDKAQWESEFGYGNVFAESSSQFDEAYGYLISLINRFAAKDGFDQMVKKFESKTLTVFEMFFILKPFGFCVDFLNAPVAGPVLRPCIDFVIENFPTLSDIDGKKGTSSSSLVDLMGYVKILLVHLHKSPEEANRVDDLRLSFVLKLLKSSNFGLRMNALKELTKLLEMLTSPNKMDERLSIGSDKLSQWLSDNEVLSLALEGNIDQAQYCDRLRTLLVFLGPRLSCQDVTKIWSLRRGRAAVTVDNVHTIVTQAATKFGRQELDHLLSLIQKSWNGESERSKEKLVILLGKIGLDTSVSYTYEQIAEILWKFAHQKISIALVNMCLEEHLNVATVSGRDTLRLDYINRCLNDIKEGSFVLPAMAQLHGLVESIKKSGFNAAKSQKTVISDLVNKRQLVESLCDNLIRMHNLSFQMWQQKTKTIIAAQPISLPPTTLQTVSSSNTSSLTVQNLSIQMPGSNIPSPDQRKVEVELEQEFGPDFLLPNGFTYGYHVDAILDFLRFVLVAGELFLLIHRCQELWDTLIADSNACSYAREAGFSWFLKGINDLEKNCQMQLFQDRMLKLDPTRYTSTGFACFRRFFESVNSNEQKLRPSSYGSQSIEVEKPDLIGSDYLWQMSLNSANDDIAKEAIDFLISLNYVQLSNRLKKDPANLHKKFLSECYRRLESAIMTLKRTPVVEFLNRSAKILAAPSVPAIIDIPEPDKHQKIRNIERLLLVAETYVKVVENSQQPGFIRVTPSHGSSYFASSFTLTTNYEDTTATPTYKRENVEILVDENETLGMIRERLAAIFGVEYARLSLEYDGKDLPLSQDHQILKVFGITTPNDPNEKRIIHAKRRFVSTYVSSYDSSSKCSEIKMVGGFNGFKQQQQALEQERNLPAVMMAQDRQVFEILYQLVSLEEPGVTTRVRELLLLIPSDSGVSEILDNLTNAMNATSSKSNSLDRKSAGGLLSKSGNESSSISEKLAAFAAGSSPKSKHKQQTPEKEIQKTKESAVDMLKPLLDLTTSGLNPFRLLYNLEVLSGRVLPTSYLDSQTLMSAQQFANGFVHIGGVQYLINILKKDSLPPNTEPSLRQNIYERVLQLLNYLLCEESTLHAVLNSQKRQIQSVKGAAAATEKSETSGNAASSSTSYASGAKATATADETAQSQNAWLTLEPPSSGKAAKDLTVELFAHVLETLQRLSWAAAGGILHLIGSDLKSPNVAGGSTAGTPWFLASPRSRTSESSTGSSDSETPSNLHSGVSSSHTVSAPEDIDIAVRSLRLLTDCLLIRPHDVQIFFNLPHLSDYVLDVLLVTDSLSVRRAAQQQFLRIADVTTLCFANLSAQQTAAPASTSSLNLRKALLRSQSHQSPPLNASQEGQSPRFLLFTILLRAPLPLWTLSSNVRGSTQRFLGQCGEYFALRGRLLAQLGQHELASIQPSPSQMLDDEVHWILGFSCSASAHLAAADNVLLTGHLELVAVLLGLMPESKPKVGQLLIEPLLDEFLFPSAKLASRISQKDENSLRRAKAADIRAKCQKQDCRAAAYALLLELCKGCVENYRVLTKMLCTVHHQPCPELLNEWDYSPLVEAKMDSGFVGLKNAGATCYMNAVLQQFLMEPGLAESILSVEVEENDNSVKLLRELQRVFGHLKESEQQYYVPKTFWEAFKFWGQQVNPREQQDAFDFFTCLISQIDEILKKNGREEIFRQRYQGVFSDQKICQGCPHRYESEEPFYALNLPVRVHNLEESLNNFVKGEILEGDNAYFCEKCGQKRTALKRTCIKSLPPVVVIQMKRFGYDWEENRSLKFNDFFQFPLQLDFFPYTSNALVQMDTGGGGEDLELGTSPSMSSSPFTQFLNSPSGPTSGLSPIAAIGTPTGRPRRHTARLSLFGVADAIRYELVGVIVHSGQANAGHYYAYIKDRRDDAVINGSFNRWFKFNDTTVELVEMTDQFMEIELFGGKYTAKTDKNSMYPEERERYWNAYLLFYRRLGSSGDSRTPKMSTNKRSVSMSCSNTPQNKKYAYHHLINPRRRDSLMELAELVEQGEQLQLFGNDLGPPAWLRQEIQEENFKFARNRDVFNSVYFSFAWRLLELACPYADSSVDNITNGGSRSTTLDVEQNLSLACAEFSLEFLVNTAWHCKKSLRGDAKVWTERLISLLRRHPVVCQYFAHYFVDNCHLLKEFLLDCQSEDVRQSFGNFVTRILFECVLSDDAVAGRAACASLLESLLSLVGKEAVERWQNATALFHIFYRITCISAEASKILLEKQAFNGLLNFMLQASSTDSPQQQTASLPSSPSGAPPAIKIPSSTVSLSRRWSVNQAKQFSDIYTTLAKLMMQCDFSAYYTAVAGSAEQQYYNPQSSISDFVDPKLQPVPDMIHIAGGDLMAGFVRELVWAACNVNQCSQSLCDLMCYLCWRNDKIGRRFVVELLVAMATTPSNDLKPVFTVTESALLLSNDDTLQQRRTDLLLDGCKDGLERVEGLLALIKSSQTTDSRRSYGCVKFLVKASEKSLELKAALNKRLEQWQWAVDWLKTRMEDEISAEASSGAGNTATGGSGSSDYGSSSSTAVVLLGPVQATSSSGTKLNVPSSHTSNEDSTTRQFQRTVSAQYTLDQANAMLKEFESSDCQIQPSSSEDALSSPLQRDAACVIEMGDGDSLCKSPTPEPIPDASMMSPPSSHQNRKKDGKKTGGSVFYIDST